MSSAICSGWILREIGLPMHCNNCLVTRFTCRKSYILAFDSGRKVFTTQRYTYIRCFGSASVRDTRVFSQYGETCHHAYNAQVINKSQACCF